MRHAFAVVAYRDVVEVEHRFIIIVIMLSGGSVMACAAVGGVTGAQSSVLLVRYAFSGFHSAVDVVCNVVVRGL